jgi:hypothetical protein
MRFCNKTLPIRVSCKLKDHNLLTPECTEQWTPELMPNIEAFYEVSDCFNEIRHLLLIQLPTLK